MSKKIPSRSQVLFALKKIEKEVIRVLGKQQENIITITDVDVFRDYIASCISAGVIAIDTETNNSLDPLTCNLMGLCLYTPGLKSAYIPINHRDPETKIRLDIQLTEEDVSRELQKILAADVKIIMHNGKFDYEVLKCTCGICVEPHWDTMVATRLLNENERYGLKEQYISKIDKSIEKYNIEKLFKDVQYADVKPEMFALYSAMDAFMTYKLYEYQIPLMDSEKRIFKLFTDIEMPLVTVVAEMELCGALADLNYCQKLKDKYEKKLTSIDLQLNDEISKLESIISRWKVSESGLERERVFPPESVVARTDLEILKKRYPLLDPTSGLRYRHGKTYASQLKDPINLSSPKQLAILLYKVLGAKVVNRRKPNGTGKHEIEAIRYEAEQTLKQLENTPKPSESKITKLKGVVSICELLSKRRQVEKIITTYLNPVPALANHWMDGKIRFHLNQLGARTGRFTSGGVWKFYDDETPVTIQGMNAQNLPAENHEIRLMFKAEPGRIFVGGDISQQEPKITAHISLDENMLQVYEEGKDIYASIAQSIYNNNYEDNLEFFDPEKTQINLEGKKRRKVGKVIILATMYGMGKRSVARKLGITPEEAEEMLNAFYSQYEGVKKAIDFSISHCKKYGFVEDVVGRKRRLPNIQLSQYQTIFVKEPTIGNKSAERILRAVLDSKEKISKEELAELRKRAKENNIVIISNEQLIRKAERQSFNARIQGGAATLTKMIMVMVARDPLIKKLGGRMVFQIHDELILDCPIENAEMVKTRLKAIMENSSTAVEIVLPMKCDMTTETRWGEDTMTTELRVALQELKAEGVENPLDKLCEEFCNFPRESIRKIIDNDNEVLENLSGGVNMGNYNDIWTSVVEFESEKKERRRKIREEKSKQREVAKLEEETVVPLVEDVALCDEVIEGEAHPLTAVGEAIDYRVIKNYSVPPFTPGRPNLEKNGALKKFKDRFGKYLAFVDCVKYFRSNKYCSILALATTSQALLNIWGSAQNVSNAFKRLEEIGLIKEYSDYYQTGMCKLYCYFVENERLLIEYCKDNSIPKMTISNKQALTKKQVNEYQERCEEVYSDEFRKGVLFKSRLRLKRPKGVKPGQFKEDLYEMLCENYPGLRIYQEMADVINTTYYNDQPEFQIRFKPKFHWNENPKKERSKDKEAIVGIGIRASNKLCSAKKDNDSIGVENKKILREEILVKYGFKFKKDITSSVPRVAYAINHGGWLKEDIDLYEKIYLEINPDATRREFEAEREAIKKLLFRVYFDSTDNKLAFHTWNKMNQEGLDRESVYEDMIKLRRAMEDVLGETRHDNYIFYVESCIYIDALHSLLEAGYKVWLVYDCFYGTGFGTQEEFEKMVIEAVWVSFVRFKAAHDFGEWGSIF